jgi:hypothetical protein
MNSIRSSTIIAAFSLAISSYGAPSTTPNSFFLTAGAGGSFSRWTPICVDFRQFTPAVEGYGSCLGRSEFYTAGFGYQFTPLISTTCEVTYRPGFCYRKFQTPATEAFSFLGAGTRTRHFEVSNTSITGNAYFYGGGIADEFVFYFLDDRCTLQPYIGAGVGVSYNTVYNFYTVLEDAANIVTVNGLNLKRAASVELPNTHVSWAGQAVAALELAHSNFTFSCGYRYFNGGKFKSNNYLTSRNSAGDASHAGTAIPWVGHLRTNEFFASLRVFLSF